MTIEGLGKKFQEARLARGLTLDEAARLTKIRPSRLAEIEADDFSQFPSVAYAKGFLLIYGKFLDVDITPYLDAFEPSQQVTVDGYSYLQQEQPAPKPQRVRHHAPVVRRTRTGGDRSSPLPLLIAVGAIIVGFVLMRLILDIQRISPHEQQIVGVPQPNGNKAPRASVAPPPPPAPATTAVPSVTMAETRRVPPPAPSVVPSAAPTTTPPPVVAKASPAPTAGATAKEPEIRRAQPVRPEDLARAGVTQSPAESEGPNQVSIKPLKKTYIKVVVDNESLKPAFERWISPSDGAVEFRGQKIAVRVLDRDAIQIKKNGKPIPEGDTDVTVE
jgi:cytoskeletal protein RodZ